MSGEVLMGKRLCLKPVRSDDIPVLYEWYRDPHLMSLYDGIPFVLESLESFTEDYGFWLENDVELELAGAFVMQHVESGKPVGECSWLLVERTGPDSPGIYQVGGIIGPSELRGKGLGSEALELLRDYLFSERDAHRLEAITGAFNTGAMKTLHRSGFVREGVLREAVLMDGVWQDRVLFSLLRSEWEQGALPQREFPSD